MGETRTGRLRAVVGRVRQVPRGRLTAGAAALALGVSVPFGGLKESYAETHPAERSAVDRLMHADPFDLTVTGASVVDAVRSYRSDGTTSLVLSPNDEANNLLLIKATVVNTSDRSVDDALLTLGTLTKGGAPRDNRVLFARADGIDLDTSSSTLSVDDATWIAKLSPGVPYHLAIATEFSGPLPASVDVGVARLSYDTGPDGSASWWQHPEPAYQLTVPVVDKRGARQRPDGWVPAEGEDG